jgi:hypothetical protein
MEEREGEREREREKSEVTQRTKKVVHGPTVTAFLISSKAPPSR